MSIRTSTRGIAYGQMEKPDDPDDLIMFRGMQERMVDTGTFLVSTSALTENWDISNQPKALQAKAAEIFPRAKASLSNAIEAGVKIALGTDAPAIWHGRNAEELEVLVKRGMTPLQAIRAATTVAADLIDRPDLGRVALGASRRIEARVLRPDGTPVAGASVRVLQPPSRLPGAPSPPWDSGWAVAARTESDASGTARFDGFGAGYRRLQASAPGCGERELRLELRLTQSATVLEGTGGVEDCSACPPRPIRAVRSL